MDKAFSFKLKSGKIQRSTKMAGWFDIFSSADAIFRPGIVTMVETGIVTEMSANLRARICERSGLALAGLETHGGCIDSDYALDWKVIMTYNHPLLVPKQSDCTEKHWSRIQQILADGHFVIKAGERVAQFKLEEVLDVEMICAEGSCFIDSDIERIGGLGSTGMI